MRSTPVFMDPKKVYQQRTKSKTNATFYKRQTLYQHIIKGNIYSIIFQNVTSDIIIHKKKHHPIQGNIYSITLCKAISIASLYARQYLRTGITLYKAISIA